MIERKALKAASIEELSGKLGMTVEDATRLTHALSDKDLKDIGATGNINMGKIKRLAEQLVIPVNNEKAAECLTAIQKFRVQKELEKDLPAHERRSAAKKAVNMTPADIAHRMSKPADQRPQNPPDTKQIIKKLKEELKQQAVKLEALQAETDVLKAENDVLKSAAQFTLSESFKSASLSEPALPLLEPEPSGQEGLPVAQRKFGCC